MSAAACTGSFSLGCNFTLMLLGCRYKAQADLPQPCWAGVDNWMNGQIYAGKPSTTPGWPGWIPVKPADFSFMDPFPAGLAGPARLAGLAGLAA